MTQRDYVTTMMMDMVIQEDIDVAHHNRNTMVGVIALGYGGSGHYVNPYIPYYI